MTEAENNLELLKSRLVIALDADNPDDDDVHDDTLPWPQNIIGPKVEAFLQALLELMGPEETARLEWMFKHKACVSWNNGTMVKGLRGHFCRFVVGGEVFLGPVKPSPREAVDAARRITVSGSTLQVPA